MATKCPKCHSENPEDTLFCGKCGTKFSSSEDIAITETFEAPREELTTGSTFAGRYQIIEELGRGGMGRVYRAKDTKLNEEMALKLIKPEIASNKKTIERFSNEVKLARKISHRYVGRMYELLEKEGTHYITMEYVSGEDLKSFIRRSGQLAVGTSLRIAAQVCEGLTEAHRLGVIHRDLKPSNIMIDKDGNSRIMDFGIARSMEGKGITGAGVMIGTPEYMPPEQAEAKEVDQRSDVYSLGVIMYEMMTGRVPFEGDTPLSIAMKHKGEVPKDPREFNSQIPEDLSDVILKCLEKDKDSRYQSAGEVRSELENIEKGMPTTERKIPERKPLTSKEITVTFGLKKLFIPVSVLVAIIAIAIIVWHPWRKEKAIPVSSDKPSLAILYFENVSGDENLDGWRSGLADLLTTDLMQSKFVRVLSGNSVFSILKKLNLNDVKKYTTEDLIKVANEGRINHIVSGSFIRAGNNIIITSILQKPHTGEVINSIKIECKGEEEIAPKVDKLTRQIKLDLNLSEEQIARDIDREVGKITTKSPEAFKYYVEGVKHFNNNNWGKSIEFFEKAISLDPEFAMAYRKIAVTYTNLRNYVKEKEYAKKAFELSNRISERERYQIQAAYYGLTWKTHDKAMEAFKKLLELYPDDFIGNGNLGRLYAINEDWDRAIKQYGVNINNKYEGPVSYSNSAFYYAAKGLYDKAKEVCELYLNTFSDNPLIRWRLGWNYLVQGRYNLALIEVDKAISLNPNWYRFYYTKGDIYHCQGDLFRARTEYEKFFDLLAKSTHLQGRERLFRMNIARGKFIEAEKEAKIGIVLAEELGDVEWASDLYFPLAYSYFSSNKPKKALDASEKALSNALVSGDFSSLKNAFRVKCLSLIGMGSLVEAQEVMNEFKEMAEKGMNRKIIREYYFLLGRLEIENGNFVKAIDQLNKAIPLLSAVSNSRALYLNSLALALFKSGDLEKSEEKYKEIIALPTGRILYGDIYAKSFYMLGKIYEHQGDTAKAIEHYEKFLDLWKDADPGIAEVEDARERLTNLKVNNP